MATFQKPYKKTARPTIDCGDGLTEQAHKKQCDMNYILRNYQKTGFINHANKHMGQYDDVTAADFQEAMFLVKRAQNMFEALPSNIRKRFQNDPAEFYRFTNDPGNKDEMIRLGIIQGVDGLDGKGQPNRHATPPLGEPTSSPGEPAPQAPATA